MRASPASAPTHSRPTPPSSGPQSSACPAGWPVASPHLCSLVLKPDLDHAHAEARLCRQCLSDLPRERETGQAQGVGRRWELAGPGRWVGRCRDPQVPTGVWKGSCCGGVSPRPTPAAPHLPAGLGGDLEGGLEGSSLLRREDGPGPLGPPWVLPIVPAALALAALPLGRLHVPVFILALHCGDTMQRVSPSPREPTACWGPITSCQHPARPNPPGPSG